MRKLKQHVTFKDLIIAFLGLIIVFILLTPLIFATEYVCKKYFDIDVLK